MKKVEELRVVDLRAELDKRGLDKTGIKAVLIDRLRKAIQSEGGNPDELETTDSPSKPNNRSFQDDDQDNSNDIKILEEIPAEVKESGESDGGPGTPAITPKPAGRSRESSLLRGKKEPQVKLDRIDSGKEVEKASPASSTQNTSQNVAKADEEKEEIPSQELEEEEEVQLIEEELMEAEPAAENEEDDDDEGQEDTEEQEGSVVSKEEYSRHMEGDSINLLLEDDDKMLDYEENDRIDMEETSNTDAKDKEEQNNDRRGTSSSDTHSKEGSSQQHPSSDKSESDNDKRTNESEDKSKDEKKEKSQVSASSSRNLWVSGLASNTRAQDLKSLFSKHGKVLSAKIVTNAKTPGAKCYGFVTMATLEDANKCINNLNRSELHGRMIQVEKAKGEPGGPKPTTASTTTPNTSITSASSTKSGSSQPSRSSASGSHRSAEKDREKQPLRRDSKGNVLDRRSRSVGERGRSHSKGAESRGSTRERSSKEQDMRGRLGTKERDLRNKLSAKDRVVDRRHEMKRGGQSNVRSKPRSPPRRDVLSFNRRYFIAGNSIAGVYGSNLDIASKYGIDDIDIHCWPNENLSYILDNLSMMIRPHHQVVVLFALTFEAWSFVPLQENQPEPRIVYPNPNFSLELTVQLLERFTTFCKGINPLMKVIVVIPTVQDMYAYNESRVKAFAPRLLSSLRSSQAFNRKSMAENCRIVYKKLFSLFRNQCSWQDKRTFSCQNILNAICRGLPAKDYLSGKVNDLNAKKALSDGLHPTPLFVDKFWEKFSRSVHSVPEGTMPPPMLPMQPPALPLLPMETVLQPSHPVQFEMQQQEDMQPYMQQPIQFQPQFPSMEMMNMNMNDGPNFMGPVMNMPIDEGGPVDPQPFITPDMAPSGPESEYIVQERERQRLRTRERLMREEERMRRDEEMHLRNLERRQKEEADRLHREREKLRMEREKIERQKQELLRLEREQQRMERVKLERERDELRKQQMKYEEVRRGVKRPAPPMNNERDRREYFEERKRSVPERGPPNRGAERGPPPPERGPVHRMPSRGGLIRGSDRMMDRDAARRAATKVGDRGRYNRYNRDPSPPLRGSGHFDDRRERDDRRPPLDRSGPRSDGRDHRPPLPGPLPVRGDRPRDSHYNGGAVNPPIDSWRQASSSHSSKNGGPGGYGPSSSAMLGSGVDSQGSWRPSGGAMSTSDRWGNSSNMSSRSNSMMDILRNAESFHMGQVPMNSVPILSNVSQSSDRFGSMASFRK